MLVINNYEALQFIDVVTMRWEGKDVTPYNPVFIYHDELINSTDDVITDVDGPGSLVCISTTQARVDWLGVTDSFGVVTTGNEGNFKQTQVIGLPSLSQLTLSQPFSDSPRSDPGTNGLWSCSIPGQRLFVAIYARAEGIGLVFPSSKLAITQTKDL